MTAKSRSSRLRRTPVVRFALAIGLLLAVGGRAQAARCPQNDPQAVTGALREMYAALSTDDDARMSAVLAPTFYAYDGGRRFDGPALLDLIRTGHAAGKTYVWTVQDADVHQDCGRAWIAYVNRGSIHDSAGDHPVTWLESANLEHDGRRWRIVFFHSTRAPPAS